MSSISGHIPFEISWPGNNKLDKMLPFGTSVPTVKEKKFLALVPNFNNSFFSVYVYLRLLEKGAGMVQASMNTLWTRSVRIN